ncbi:MAG TPA: hypothetical protein H9861_01180 [Candidatus Ligilactobacillus excrementigallinarum]|uniref:Uncharacterized protein n=1 Tax=Candidatus Ligilactobacillus excrementigallinarum TaxID=2838641 RepID=A0A9D1UVW1_9LACO|nr:hypothetical protein [Candidatus Ligilactobacillus excrementigallinarum]
MIKDLEKIIGEGFFGEKVNFIEMALIVSFYIMSAYIIFKFYGVVALITCYVTNYFTRKKVNNNGDEY